MPITWMKTANERTVPYYNERVCNMLTGKTTFVKACKDFFGLEGPQMVTELKALTMEDRVELHAGLAQAGYDLEPLGVKPAAQPALVGV